MEYTKIPKEIFDPIKANKAKFQEKFGEQLAELFPAAVKDGVVDFSALLAELGQYVDAEERYELNWAGKAEAKRIANSDIVGKTLKYVPEDSKNPETTQNVYIEGDNLEALKLIRNSYYNKIKAIYIDPPYNTGNDFVYNDQFSISSVLAQELEGDIDQYGERLVVNQKGNSHFHTKWLNMMYPRLLLARELLTDDGAIFISIDDNEVHNLRLLCDLVFKGNFVAQITTLCNPKGRSQDKYFATNHEYILVYSKTALPKGYFSIEKEEDQINAEYPEVDENGEKYRLIELRNTHREFGKHNRKNLYYPIYFNPNTNEIDLVENEGFVAIEPIWNDGFEGCWTWDRTKAEKDIALLEVKEVNGQWKVYRRSYAQGSEKMLKTIFNDKSYYTEKGQSTFSQLFGTKAKLFQSPKSVDLIATLLKTIVGKDDIVLDFFSGSSTTAHAVMQLNLEDNGNRKYIMVQIPEKCDQSSEAFKAGYKNICEIGKERIRRAGDKIKEENKDKEDIDNLDIGFKVFRVADTNIRWFSEAIKSDILDYDMTMTDKDRLDFNPGFTDIDVVYEILLRHRDIPLSTNVEQLSDIGTRTYIFADTVVVCLEESITEQMIDKIAAIEPMPTKIIFRDSAFGDDISLKENTMIRLETQIRKQSGLEKRAYRVEFI